MQGLKKLRIQTKLSKKVSQTIVRHPELREFKLSCRMKRQTITSVLTVICSQGCQATILNLNQTNMVGVDPGLLARAVTKVETLKVIDAKLTQQQAVAILNAVSKGRKLAKLDISGNDLPEVDLGLLAKAVTKLETLEVIGTKLTQQQAVAILTTVSEGSKLTKIHICCNNHTF